MGKDGAWFAINAILQIPVYMIADEDAYNYFPGREADMSHPKKHLTEVAQMLGISRSYVSRIEKKALQKLRKALEDWQ